MGWTNKESEFDYGQEQATSFHTFQTGLRPIKLQMLFFRQQNGCSVTLATHLLLPKL
jgi:hypothetical protein